MELTTPCSHLCHLQVLCLVTEATEAFDLTEDLGSEMVNAGHISAYRLDNRHLLHNVGLERIRIHVLDPLPGLTPDPEVMKVRRLP